VTLGSELKFVLARKQRRRSVGMEKRVGLEIQDSQCTVRINTTSGSVLATIIVVEKQQVLHIVSVCL